MTPRRHALVRIPPGLLACLLIGLFWVAGCSSADDPLPDAAAPAPAMWEIESASGERGWLFGTIHALPRGTQWRTQRLEQALSQARMLVLEVPRLDDQKAIAEAVAQLARTPGLGPVSRRVDPADARQVTAALTAAGIDDARTTSLETWAVALSLNSSTGCGGEGIDRQLLASWTRQPFSRPVGGLESVADQLGAFDRLTPRDQAELLVSVIEEMQTPQKRTAMVEAWRVGDIGSIGALTREGLLAHTALRESLLVRRNEAWVPRIERLVDQGRTPFIAVGVGHLTGRDGLPALLSARGLAVRRIQ